MAWASGDSLTPSTLNRVVPSWASSAVSALGLGVFNVKDYGAAGNGIADDTSAISSAVAAASAHTYRGIVYLPPGAYVLSDEIHITSSGIIIQGGGQDNSTGSTGYGTRLFQTSSTKDAIRVSGTANALNNVHIRDLSIIGKPSGTSGSGIHVEATGNTIRDVTIRNVTVQSCASHGVHMNGSSNYLFSFSLADCVLINNSGNGLRLYNATQGDLGRIYCDDNDSDAAHFTGTAALPTADITCHQLTVALAPSGKYGLRLTLCRDVNIFGLYTESNVSGEILCESVRGLTLMGGKITQEGSAKGLVVKYSGVNQNDLFYVSVPQWTNTSSQPRVDLTDNATATQDLVFVQHADGFFSSSDFTGLEANFPAERIWLWPKQTYNQYQAPSGTALVPGMGYGSEVSLGLYRSEASTMAQSYGTLSVPGISAAIFASSSTTAQSGATARLGQGQLFFSILSLTSNGAEFGIRSGNTAYRWYSDAVG